MWKHVLRKEQSPRDSGKKARKKSNNTPLIDVAFTSWDKEYYLALPLHRCVYSQNFPKVFEKNHRHFARMGLDPKTFANLEQVSHQLDHRDRPVSSGSSVTALVQNRVYSKFGKYSAQT